MRIGLVGLLCCAVALAATPLLAQRTTAVVRGKVTTPDGVALPGARAAIRGVDTGLERTAVTNAEGRYVLAELPIGEYVLDVTSPDFRPVTVENIVLTIGENRVVDVALEVGGVSDEITVTSPIIVVETVGGEVSSILTGEEIQELPLNGRNFTQLTQLMPGVSAPDGLDFKNKGLLSGVDLSVSGSSVTGNQWAIDGAANNDVGSNRTILVTPSVDAIEEFKIHRNSYGPEFGGAGGAQVNIVTKSGTNRFKGSVFGYFRDDSLNETNHLLEETGQEKEQIDRKDYGYTVGGPILRDRLHFFLSQEWNDETRGTVRSAVVPTALERQGDFSQSTGCSQPIPIDPLTGQPFPGNVIPADRLSTAGVALLGLYPLPNVTPTDGCTNWVDAVPTDIDWDQINGRMDFTVTQSANALVRYTRDNWVNPAPNAGVGNGLWGDDPFPAVDSTWDQPGESVVAQLSNVLTGSQINTFTYSWSGNEIDISRGPEGQALNDQLNALIPTSFPEDDKLTGADRSHPVYWGGATGVDLWNIAPWSNELEIAVFKDDYQQVFGNHWLKGGVLYGESEKAENCCGASASETPHFWGAAGIGGWGATSGNRIADILIDDMYHGFDETARQANPNLEWEDLEAYVGDSWTINDRMTLDYGLRWSKFDAPEARENDIVAFYPELFDPALGNAACNGIAQVPGTDPCGAAGLAGGGVGAGPGLVEDDNDNFAPRLGFAWNVFGDGDSVLRAGFGQYYQRERVNIQLDFGNQPPFTRNTSGIRPLDGPLPDTGAGFGVPNRGIDPDNETPYNLQFNLTWEQRLGRESTIEIGYVGNRGKHLTQKYDVNQIAPGDADGNGVDDRLQFARSGGDGDGSVRPFFDGAANRILYWDNRGESEYDALQTQLRSRFGRGSILQVSYTYSDFEANTSVASSSAGEEASQLTDLADPSLDWGPADLHREHIFNTSLVWNGPSFDNRGGILHHLLGNWTVGTVVSYASGTPITVYVRSIQGLGGGGFAGTGYTDNQRPIRVDGVSCGGSGDQIINPGAFTLSGLRLGDTSQMSGRGQCEGPDYFQADLAFYKTIPLPGEFDVQLRFEVFNVTNEVNYIASSVNNVITPNNVVFDAPLDQATTIVSAEIPNDFGRAFAVRDPRQMQLGLRISF